MASTTDTGSKIIKITGLLHEVSNDLEREFLPIDLYFLQGRINAMKQIVKQIDGQIKYKIKDGK